VRRFIGLILIVTGVFGLAISAVGLLVVWQGTAMAGAAAERELAALDHALLTTDDGLAVAKGSLTDAQNTLASLAATIGGATRTITDTLPVLDNIGGLAGDELPKMVRSTQAALGSAQETARVVDSVLGTISGFGLISSATYNPKVPLGDSIGQVSASLNTLPGSLEKVATGVGTARTNLGQLNKDLGAVATGIDGVRANLDQAAGVVTQYRGIVGDLRAQVAAIRAAPTWIDMAGLGVGLLLIWLALAQLAIFAQGFEMLRRK
jgi:methyl-accepting chemotaxis protein